MPCPACSADPEGTEWKSDPLRWDLVPPCSEDEWAYLRDLPQAPDLLAVQKCGYMNKICRGCYNARLEIAAKVRSRIRDRGGLQELNPTQKMEKQYEAAHAHDIVARRPAKINGLQSESASHMNGKLCKLVSKDEQTQRWTVELLSGEQKAIKETNLEVSREIDGEYEMERLRRQLERANTSAAPDAARAADPPTAEKRPLGARTAWPKVQGVHPGAVVRLAGLRGAPELNGRKGRCVSFDAENGRWTVDLGDERKALRTENLTPAPKERPPTRQSAEEEKKAVVDKLDRRSQMSAKEVYAEDYGWVG